MTKEELNQMAEFVKEIFDIKMNTRDDMYFITIKSDEEKTESDILYCLNDDIQWEYYDTEEKLDQGTKMFNNAIRKQEFRKYPAIITNKDNSIQIKFNEKHPILLMPVDGSEGRIYMKKHIDDDDYDDDDNDGNKIVIRYQITSDDETNDDYWHMKKTNFSYAQYEENYSNPNDDHRSINIAADGSAIEIKYVDKKYSICIKPHKTQIGHLDITQSPKGFIVIKYTSNDIQ